MSEKVFKVTKTAPTASTTSSRAYLHPSSLRACGIQAGSPAVLVAHDASGARQTGCLVTNLWPNSSLEVDAILLSQSSSSDESITSVSIFPLKEQDVGSAISIVVRCSETTSENGDESGEQARLLQIHARESLVGQGYCWAGQRWQVAGFGSHRRQRSMETVEVNSQRISSSSRKWPEDVISTVAKVSRATRVIIEWESGKNDKNGQLAVGQVNGTTKSVQKSSQNPGSYAALGGLDRQIEQIRQLVEMPLTRPDVFQKYGLKPPRGVLLYGPPGTGKTSLAHAAASACVDPGSIHIVSGPELSSSFHGGTERSLRRLFERAQRTTPSVVIIDEIDALAPRRDAGGGADGSGGMEGAGEVERRVVATLLTLLDGLGLSSSKSQKGESSHGETNEGSEDGRIVVIAATNRPNAIDPALRRPGRLDREIEIGVPSSEARRSILDVLLRGVPHTLRGDEKRQLADQCHGFVGADMASLVREAGMCAVTRELLHPNSSSDEGLHTTPLDAVVSKLDDVSLSHTGPNGGSFSANGNKVTLADFQHAQTVVRPSAMREITLELPKVRWSDIATGQAGAKVQSQIRECVEWPLKHADTLARLGIQAPKGLLLYGPPGCSKTLIAKALATESGLNFVAVKGPELLNKYVGESERSLREVFRKARAASPSIIFFDEIDGLTTTRGDGDGGGSESSHSDRLIATLLNEMDGVEGLGHVVVVAATNRPQVIDPALLRPGRLDRLLYVGPPDLEARRKLLEIRSSKMTFGSDVNLDEIATMVSDFLYYNTSWLECGTDRIFVYRRLMAAPGRRWSRFVRMLA